MTEFVDRSSARAAQEKLFPRRTWRAVGPHPDRPAENPPVIEEWGHAPTLPEICIRLRASVTGASDPWSDGRLRAVCDMLAARVASWEHADCDVIDQCVYLMCRAAVDIATKELADRTARGVTYHESDSNCSS